jgi:hypothetical protein
MSAKRQVSILLLKIWNGGQKMKPAGISPLMRAISFLIAVCLAGFEAQARHGGDMETPDDQVYFADTVLKAHVEAQLVVTNPTVADMVFLKELGCREGASATLPVWNTRRTDKPESRRALLLLGLAAGAAH